MFSDLKGLPLQPHTDSSPSPGTGVCLGQYIPCLTCFNLKKPHYSAISAISSQARCSFQDNSQHTHTKHHPISISLQMDFSFLWTALSSYSFHKEPEGSHVPFAAVQSQTLWQQQVHFHLGIQLKHKGFKGNRE